MTMLEKSVSDLKDSVLNLTLKVGTDLGNLDQFVIGVNETLDRLREEMKAIGAGAGQGIDGVVANKANEAKAKIEASIPNKIAPEVTALKSDLKTDAQAYVDSLRNGKLITPDKIEVVGESQYVKGFVAILDAVASKVDKIIVTNGKDTPLLDVQISVALPANTSTFSISGPLDGMPLFGFQCEYRTDNLELVYEGSPVFKGIVKGKVAGRVAYRPAAGGTTRFVEIAGLPDVELNVVYGPANATGLQGLATIYAELTVSSARELLGFIKESLPAEVKSLNVYWQFEVSQVTFKGKVLRVE